MKTGKILAFYMGFVLITTTFTMAVLPVTIGQIGGDESMFELITGTTGEGNYSEETKDWEKGDFVGFRLSKDAWFYIIYGNQNNRSHITMASVQLRYLGGATIQDKDGNDIIDQIGIPVVTVYGQSLLGLFEFQDEGYTPKNMFGEPTNETKGAHNNLWDFKRTANGLEEWDDSFVYTEPVVKAAMLNTSWNRSEIIESQNENGSHSYDFSLSAEDLEYGDDKGKIWDPDFQNDETNDTSIEKVEFTFHIDISVDDVSINGIPWYDIRIDGRGDDLQVISSRGAGSRDFDGKAVNAQYKYDHYIEGWDFKDLEKDSKLMLESVSMFGTFVPDIVHEWFDKQFVEGIEGALGFAEYEYDNAGDVVDAVIGEESTAPDRAHLVQKESISFNDNWRRVGEQTWVSDVEVDNETTDTFYQIHAGQNKTGRSKDDNGHFKALVLLGGYIYPAGSVIYHDPGFSATAILIDIDSKLLLFPAGIIGLQFLIAVVAVSGAGVIGIRKRRKT